MVELAAKTPEEHGVFLHELAALMLNFAWGWWASHDDESFAEVMRNRIDLYRKTDINPDVGYTPRRDYDHPEWRCLENILSELAAESDNADSFEQRAIRVVSPHLTDRAERDFNEPPIFHDFQCGCLKFDPPNEKFPGLVFIHIANPLAPKSIFDEPIYMVDCLKKLIGKSNAQYGANGLCTPSWLNSHPAWLKFFPDEWRDNMKPPDTDVRGHGGFWGQFINAKGLLNHRLGEQLRTGGEFPYWPRLSHCSFETLEKHLAAKFPG